MRQKLESFSRRISRRVILSVLVIMAIISVVVFFVAAAAMLMFTMKHYSDTMDKAKGNMALIMSKVEVSAENIIDELSWHLANPDMVSETLEYELNTNRHIYGCGMGFVADFFPEEGRWFEPYVLNAGDSLQLKQIGGETHDYFNAEWYKLGLNSPEGIWSDPYFDKEGGGTILCTYARQVRKMPEGTLAGAFGADISLNGLSQLITESIAKENTELVFRSLAPDDTTLFIYSFIIGPNGDYIVHPDKERILKTNFYDYAVGKGADKYRQLGDAMMAGESGEKTVYMDGIKSDVYYSPLLDSGWSMGIVVPSQRLLMPGYIIGAIIILLILLGLLVIFIICYQTIKKTSRPLIQLADSAHEIAQGNFDTELPEIKTHDEIGLLRDSFDNMQKSLGQYVQELTETTAQKASMERDLGVARSIQMSMLPTTWPAFPDRKDLDIYGSVTPAKTVGGDLFDFRLRDEKLFFCIGDVSGKGIPASLVMTVISSLFQTLSASEDNPADIISGINSSMSARNESMMFVTLFIGVLDLSNGELLYANAGHNAPVVLAGGEPRMLAVDANVPVGILPDNAFSLQQTTLPPGTILFLYTDGLTEATRTDGQLFGEERVLAQLACSGENRSVEGIIVQMADAVARFVGDAEQSDDLTMLAIKRLGVSQSTED